MMRIVLATGRVVLFCENKTVDMIDALRQLRATQNVVSVIVGRKIAGK